MARITNICITLAAALMLYSATYLSGPLEAPRKPVRWNSQAEVEEVLQTIRRPPQPPHGSVGTPSDAPVIDSGGGASPATGGAATPQSVTLQPPPPPPPQQQALASKTAASTLDGSLDAALKLAAPGGPGFLLVTFSNAALKDHLLNFVAHLRDAGAAYLIGAVDVETFELLKELSPVYKTPLALSGFALDGSNQHSSGSWKRFAGMRSGEVTRIVSMGYSVLHTDTDVVWLRNPMPYLMCTPAAAQGEFSPASRFPCEAILKADVAVSSDNMSPGRDTEAHAGYSAGGTFNTGILFFRGNAQGQLFAKTWSDNVNSPARGTRFAGDTSDQQVFNHMHRDPKYWPGIKGVQGEHTMRTYYEEEGHVAARQGFRLGALPMALFQNGHGYFVASTHRRLGVAPMAVHATYSLDRHDGVAKRQRFRETGLWRSDPPSYYEGRFLAFNSTVSPRLQRAIDGFAASRKSANNIGIHAKALREHASARSTWPSWRGHSWPPAARQAAYGGLGLPSALRQSSPSPQVPPRSRGPPAKRRPSGHFAACDPAGTSPSCATRWRSRARSSGRWCCRAGRATATGSGRRPTTSSTSAACTRARRTATSYRSRARWTTCSRRPTGRAPA